MQPEQEFHAWKEEREKFWEQLWALQIPAGWAEPAWQPQGRGVQSSAGAAWGGEAK